MGVRLINWELYHEDIENLFLDDQSRSFSSIAKKIIKNNNLDYSVESFRKYISIYIKNTFADKEIVMENVRLAKSKQKAQDHNRIANKSFREYARVENAVEEYGKELVKLNKQYGAKLKQLSFKPLKKSKVKGTGVIQITDIHTNELIDLPHNKYDYNVFAKRLRKHINESLDFFDFKGVNHVVLAFTGDLMNSDRRRDEMLSASTNRSKATILTTHVLKQAIVEIRKRYPVTIVSVLGNESRADQEMTFSKEGLSHNYDFTIIAQLHQMFSFAGISGVDFAGYSNVEEVVKIEKQNWLLCHNLSRMLDGQKDTQSTIGRYSLSGVNIDFIIGGHIHACRVTDISARSSSMAGSNSYNEHALNLMGKATHNAYWACGKERVVIVNDLQDVSAIDGYEIVSQLEAYNAKSVEKTRRVNPILQINTLI